MEFCDAKCILMWKMTLTAALMLQQTAVQCIRPITSFNSIGNVILSKSASQHEKWIHIWITNLISRNTLN